MQDVLQFETLNPSLYLWSPIYQFISDADKHSSYVGAGYGVKA